MKPIKRLFISQPMSGKKEREILEDRVKILEQLQTFSIYEKDIEVINTYIKSEPPENSNVRLWYLGKTIELLAQADLIIFAEDWQKARGCRIEHECAKTYKIPMIVIKSDKEVEIEE